MGQNFKSFLYYDELVITKGQNLAGAIANFCEVALFSLFP